MNLYLRGLIRMGAIAGVLGSLPFGAQAGFVSWSGARTPVETSESIRAQRPMVVPAVGERAAFKVAFSDYDTDGSRKDYHAGCQIRKEGPGEILIGNGGAAVTESCAAMVGFDTASALDATTLDRMRVTLRKENSSDQTAFRWFVQVGGSTYVSEVVSANVSIWYATYTLDSDTPVEWFRLDKTKSLGDDAVGASVGKQPLKNLRVEKLMSAGIYVQHTFPAPAIWHGIRIKRFEIGEAIAPSAKRPAKTAAVPVEAAAVSVKTAKYPKQGAESKGPLLRRGVEVEVEIEGLIASHPHRVRTDKIIYTLQSFDGEEHELPRWGQNTTPGINLEEWVGTCAKVKLRIIPEATGIMWRVPITYLVGLEKMDQLEGEKRKKELEAKKIADRARTLNPSPNALPYSGTWGVRMALPSEKNGSKAVENFDVNAFAKQVAQLKTATYVILNVTQPSGPYWFTGPHPELEKILQTRPHWKGPKYPNRGSFPRRDLLGEVLDAVRKTGKKTLVYFACEGFMPEMGEKREPVKTAWFDYIESQGMNHHEAVRKLLLKHYADRYGTKIDGWWFDGAGVIRNEEERSAWKETVYSANPKAIVAFNSMAGPPFRSKAQCDYFGGHPEPRKSNKFYDDVQLPMITAIEAGPWMNCSGEPVDDPKMGALGHMFIGMQDRWTSGKLDFPEERAIDWTTRVVAAGGMFTWSAPRAGSVMAKEQFQLLQKIDKAVGNLRKRQ